MYNPKDIIDLLADNVRKTRNPFGVPNALMNRWWKGIDLPQTGRTILYTGLMYQAVPYIEETTRYLERYEDTWVARYVRFTRHVPKLFSGLGLFLTTSFKEKARFNQILKNIASVLQKSGVRFAYRPDLDFYSGILLYDLGDLDGFVSHARFVAEKLNDSGVRNIITVDPHTTYALKILYPKYVGTHFNVKAYFELVDLPAKENGKPVTLHDPCFYGRYLELSDVPNNLLKKLGYQCVPVRNSGPFTNCCGGPAESVSPQLAREIMERRVEELRSTGAQIVAMCPICMGNLAKSGAEVEDLSSLLIRAA